MLSRVIAKNVGDVFLDTVYMQSHGKNCSFEKKRRKFITHKCSLPLSTNMKSYQ